MARMASAAVRARTATSASGIPDAEGASGGMRVHLHVVRGRGVPQALEIETPTSEEARRQALRDGYTVLALRPAVFDWRSVLGARGAVAGRFDTAVFIEQLRDLLGAGLSLIEALDTLQRAASARDRLVLDALSQRLRGGECLSDALAADAPFSPLL